MDIVDLAAIDLQICGAGSPTNKGSPIACTLHKVAEGSAIDVQIGGVGSPTNKGSPIDLQISG